MSDDSLEKKQGDGEEAKGWSKWRLSLPAVAVGMFAFSAAVGQLEDGETGWAYAKISIWICVLSWGILQIDRWFGPVKKVEKFLYHFIRPLCVLAFLILWLTVISPIPGLLESRQAANESTAIGHLRTIVTAEQQFRTLKKVKNKQGVRRYGTMEELVRHGMIDGDLSSQSDYKYTLHLSPNRLRFSVVAVPQVRKEDYQPTFFRGILEGSGYLSKKYSGTRSFYIDNSGTLHYETTDRLPTSKSPSVD